MTATCREPCCNAAPRLTVTELFERGLRRSRAAPLAIEGPECADGEGDAAQFSLDLLSGRIERVGFRASPCATLIAYCELIAETAPALSLDLAQRFSSADLVNLLPGVPPLKRGRAVLAIAAFRAALAAASASRSFNGDTRNESRLHLRHAAP